MATRSSCSARSSFNRASRSSAFKSGRVGVNMRGVWHELASAASCYAATHKRMCKTYLALHHGLRLPAALRMPPVDPLEQHRKLRLRQGDHAARRLWPHESSAFQALGKQAEPVSVEPKQFNQVATTAAKNEHLAGKWVLLERRLHLGAQPHKAAPQVGHAGHDPDTCAGGNHARSASSTIRTRMGSVLPSIRICA